SCRPGCARRAGPRRSSRSPAFTKGGSHDVDLRRSILPHRGRRAAGLPRRLRRGRRRGRGALDHRSGHCRRGVDARAAPPAVRRLLRVPDTRAPGALRPAAHLRDAAVAGRAGARSRVRRTGHRLLALREPAGTGREPRCAVEVAGRRHVRGVSRLVSVGVGDSGLFVPHRVRDWLAPGDDHSAAGSVGIAVAAAWRHGTGSGERRRPCGARGHGRSTRRRRVRHRARCDAARGVAMSDVVLCANQTLGVIGPNGAGKTTLLRVIAGLFPSSSGDMRVRGLEPARAAARVNVAYFAGDFTLPGAVRACDWGTLATGDVLTAERRRIRTLSRGTRQLLGLRTVLSRPHPGLVVLDEPWEALDVDGSRWLSRTLEAKRDRGAAIVLASHDPHDLAGICDLYLFLVNR